MIASYKQLLSKRRLTPRLFSLEIIEKLYNRLPTDPPYGITELYDSVAQPKPTFSIYRRLLTELEAVGSIHIQTSKRKASKKAVVLSNDFRREFELFIYN